MIAGRSARPDGSRGGRKGRTLQRAVRQQQRESSTGLLSGLAASPGPSVNYRVEFVTRIGILMFGGHLDTHALLAHLRQLEVRRAMRALKGSANIEGFLDCLAEGRVGAKEQEYARLFAVASWVRDSAANRRAGVALLRQEPDAFFNVVLSATRSEASFHDWPGDVEALKKPSRTALEFLAIDYGRVGGRA